MKRCWILLAAVALMGGTVRAGDDDKPFDQQKAEMRQEAETEAQQLKPIKAKNIEDVMKFSIEGNDLAMHTTLTPTDGYARLNVNGLSGFAKVMVKSNNGVSAFSLIHQDFAPSDAVVVLTMVFCAPNQLQVSRDEDRLDEIKNIQLIQSDQYTADGEGKIKLYINVSKRLTGEVVADMKLSAANILELRRKYPLEVAKYVEPIFRDLHQEAILGQVDPRLAWQVFAPLYQPSAELQDNVMKLAARLDADAFPDREAASNQLQKLGAPAAMVLMKLPRSGMSEEKQTRIDALVAPYKPLPDEEAMRLRKDKFFLMDCLYTDDLQIRRWALGELQKSVGHEIAFNLTAPKPQRDQAVSALRASVLGATTRPAATQPVSTQPDGDNDPAEISH